VSEGYNRNFEGAGLGLTITKNFVEKMGGRITLESSPGKGSSFKVIFPVFNKYSIENKTIIKQTDLENNLVLQSDKTEKVLIIDDDPATRKIIELFLKDEIITKSVSNIKDALNEASLDEFSLVLMDISLGQGVSGVDLLKNFRKMSFYKNVPIIAVTAHAMVGDKERFLSEGFDDYLSKPFSKRDLINRVKSWKNGRIKK
jgi:CheY-like chemotaxis protein